jgi:NTE family protein
MYFRFRTFLLAAFLITGCSSLVTQPTHTTSSSNQVSATSSAQSTAPSTQAAIPNIVKPKIALALGGGAARGFAHIGVIKALEANGITPDYIAGTSAGAVVGALYAGGYDAAGLQKIAQRLDESLFADWTFFGRGLLKGEALQDFINNRLRNRAIEQLNKPFAAVATELSTGKSVIFRSGDPGLAVRASAAVPGVFQPAQFRGKSYVDGGLTSPVPVRAAREMGGTVVIAVDISTQPNGQPIDSMPNVLWQTITIMGGVIGQFETSQADILIRPNMPYVKSWDFNARHRALLEGEKAALAALPQIRQKIAAASGAP